MSAEACLADDLVVGLEADRLDLRLVRPARRGVGVASEEMDGTMVGEGGVRPAIGPDGEPVAAERERAPEPAREGSRARIRERCDELPVLSTRLWVDRGELIDVDAPRDDRGAVRAAEAIADEVAVAVEDEVEEVVRPRCALRGTKNLRCADPCAAVEAVDVHPADRHARAVRPSWLRNGDAVARRRHGRAEAGQRARGRRWGREALLEHPFAA